MGEYPLTVRTWGPQSSCLIRHAKPYSHPKSADPLASSPSHNTLSPSGRPPHPSHTPLATIPALPHPHTPLTSFPIPSPCPVQPPSIVPRLGGQGTMLVYRAMEVNTKTFI